MNSNPRIISVLGAECTGKTQLCAALGARLPALIVPEYLRSWCDQKRRTPERQEQTHIIKGQLDAEDSASVAAPRSGLQWVVVDSSPLMTAIYSLEYFDDDTHCAQALAHQRRYSLTLVADSAIQWLAGDWQRDSEQRRASAQQRLLMLLNDAGIEYRIIAGDPEQRLQRALDWTHASVTLSIHARGPA
jgi:nicotinamide riboside kinase